ncbi:MAG: hypothetical protein EB058_10630 [Proteobacteria bacterium]|nr:hypothetical protein [Chloroflexota bacterium]NDF09125.1 hypothetical protein [Pseudomonadota bacterium]
MLREASITSLLLYVKREYPELVSCPYSFWFCTPRAPWQVGNRGVWTPGNTLVAFTCAQPGRLASRARSGRSGLVPSGEGEADQSVARFGVSPSPVLAHDGSVCGVACERYGGLSRLGGQLIWN